MSGLSGGEVDALVADGTDNASEYGRDLIQCPLTALLTDAPVARTQVRLKRLTTLLERYIRPAQALDYTSNRDPGL